MTRNSIPRFSARVSASSKLSLDEYLVGMNTPNTFSFPSASFAITATRAESIPPEIPMTPLRIMLLASLASALLLAGCSGSSGADPQADAGKTPAQIQADVAKADRPALQQAVDTYRTLIASKESEVRSLEAMLKEKAGGALDAVLGQGKTDDVKAEVAKLQAQVEALQKDLAALREKLAIYVAELAKRPA